MSDAKYIKDFRKQAMDLLVEESGGDEFTKVHRLEVAITALQLQLFKYFGLTDEQSKEIHDRYKRLGITDE